MTKENMSTFGLKLKQLADLFSVGVESIEADESHDTVSALAGRLGRYLDHALSEDPALLEAVQTALERQGYDGSALGNRMVRAVLHDADIPLGLFQALKTYFKKMEYATVNQTEKALAVTMYHAALAGALVNHHRNISRTSVAVLDQSFALLAQKDWMVPEFKELFMQARQICRDKMKEA